MIKTLRENDKMRNSNTKSIEKKAVFIFGIVFLVFFSCTGTGQIPLYGIYRGILPAASSAGIDYLLELRDKGMFLERMQYLDHESGVYIRSASYSETKKGLICLDSDPAFCFSVEGSQLRMRSFTNQKPIRGKLAEHYVLKKEDKDSLFSEALQIHGNEPFWGLTLQPGNYLHFQTLESPDWEIKIDIPDFVLQFQDSTAYIRIENPDIMIEITVWTRACSDQMSDILYPMSSEIKIQTPLGERHYKGCARYKNQALDHSP